MLEMNVLCTKLLVLWWIYTDIFIYQKSGRYIHFMDIIINLDPCAPKTRERFDLHVTLHREKFLKIKTNLMQ